MIINLSSTNKSAVVSTTQVSDFVDKFCTDQASPAVSEVASNCVSITPDSSSDFNLHGMLSNIKEVGSDYIEIKSGDITPFNKETLVSLVSSLRTATPCFTSINVFLEFPLEGTPGVFDNHSKFLNYVDDLSNAVMKNNECVSYLDEMGVSLSVDISDNIVEVLPVYLDDIVSNYESMQGYPSIKDTYNSTPTCSPIKWSVSARLADNNPDSTLTPYQLPATSSTLAYIDIGIMTIKADIEVLNELVNELNDATDAICPTSEASMQTNISSSPSGANSVDYISLNLHIITNNEKLIEYIKYECLEHTSRLTPSAVLASSLRITYQTDLLLASKGMEFCDGDADDEDYEDTEGYETAADGPDDVLLSPLASTTDIRATIAQQKELSDQKASMLANNQYEPSPLADTPAFDDFEYKEPSELTTLGAPPSYSKEVAQTTLASMGLNSCSLQSVAGGCVKEVSLRLNPRPVSLDIPVLYASTPFNILLLPFDYSELAMDNTDSFKNGVSVVFPMDAEKEEQAAVEGSVYADRFLFNAPPIEGEYGSVSNLSSPYTPTLQALFGFDDKAMIDDELYIFDTRIPVSIEIADISNLDTIGEFVSTSAYVVFYCAPKSAPIVLIQNPQMET